MEAKKQIKVRGQLRKLTWSEKWVPELHMSGVWLEKAGFEIGQVVEIEIRENQLIMRTSSNDD